MRLILSCLLVLACAGQPAVASSSAPLPACTVTRPAADPPAWLLLAAAVVLVGAGRLAAS